MDTFTTRRANLRYLIDTKFGRNQAAFAEAVGCKPPQVNRWLSTTATDPRNITETSARSMERKLGLISGWLDQENHDADATEMVCPAWLSEAEFSASSDRRKQLAAAYADMVTAGEISVEAALSLWRLSKTN